MTHQTTLLTPPPQLGVAPLRDEKFLQKPRSSISDLAHLGNSTTGLGNKSKQNPLTQTNLEVIQAFLRSCPADSLMISVTKAQVIVGCGACVTISL